MGSTGSFCFSLKAGRGQPSHLCNSLYPLSLLFSLAVSQIHYWQLPVKSQFNEALRLHFNKYQKCILALIGSIIDSYLIFPIKAWFQFRIPLEGFMVTAVYKGRTLHSSSQAGKQTEVVWFLQFIINWKGNEMCFSVTDRFPFISSSHFHFFILSPNFSKKNRGYENSLFKHVHWMKSFFCCLAKVWTLGNLIASCLLQMNKLDNPASTIFKTK